MRAIIDALGHAARSWHGTRRRVTFVAPTAVTAPRAAATSTPHTRLLRARA